LTVTQQQQQQQQLQAGEGSKHLRSQLHAISASPHCSRVEVLHLHQVCIASLCLPQKLRARCMLPILYAGFQTCHCSCL
jgi:hypothetical protein